MPNSFPFGIQYSKQNDVAGMYVAIFLVAYLKTQESSAAYCVERDGQDGIPKKSHLFLEVSAGYPMVELVFTSLCYSR